MPLVKPKYEFIRYDIRPPSGLTDVESDYLVKCVDQLQTHKNVTGVRFAFELPGAAYPKRSTGKHGHLGIWRKGGFRTDKIPIINMAKYAKSRGWPKHAIKVVTSELFTPGEYWKCGYIEKDGQSIGNIRPMLEFWHDHERALKSTVVRPPDMTCGSIVGDVVNWWYQNHEYIKRTHAKLVGETNALGIRASEPVDIRHVYAHYMISNHPNLRINCRKARRLWLAQTNWSDYETIVKMITDTELLEQDTPGGVFDTRFEYTPRKYHPMDAIYPIV